jgi:hypothetical protein
MIKSLLEVVKAMTKANQVKMRAALNAIQYELAGGFTVFAAQRTWASKCNSSRRLKKFTCGYKHLSIRGTEQK